jgi:predicted transcriptional regulator
MNDLINIDNDVVAELVQHNDILMNDLTNINNDVVTELVQHNGTILYSDE